MTKLASGLVVSDLTTLPNVSPWGVDQIVLTVPWSDINPNDEDWDLQVINDVLSVYPTSRVNIRIKSGSDCPNWVKELHGTIAVFNTVTSEWADVCHWWKPGPMEAWSRIIEVLGQIFEYPEGPIVTISADLATVFDSPYNLGGDTDSAIRLYNAGLNETTMKEAIRRCVRDTTLAFPSALVEFTIDPSMQIPTELGMTSSWTKGREFALSLANAHRRQLLISYNKLGVSNTYANHHTSEGNLTDKYDIYDWMQFRTTDEAGTAQGPISYRLFPDGYTAPEDYIQMAQNAVDLGAQQCETPVWDDLGETEGTRLDTALKANALEYPYDYPPTPGVQFISVKSGEAWVSKRFVRF